MSFNTFGLMPEIVLAIDEKGYNEPTPIQQEAIPQILDGKDILAGSQTGTGKSASFILPLLHNLMQKKIDEKKCPIRSLILVPTRELAAQIDESVRAYGKHLPLRSLAVYGGVNIAMQIKKLRRGIDVLVATPGRLLDLVNQQAAHLSEVEVVVLDEADRMLDMGFIHDIRKILSMISKKRQSLLFSATFSKEIKKLAEDLLASPSIIQMKSDTSAAENVSQSVYPVDNKRKKELLSFLIKSNNGKQALVFTRTKHCANKLTMQLEKDGIKAVAIHGNKTQAARMKALADFKREKFQILVATDIAARGLDIDQLPFVVNFELPQVPEDYVHRIGRTGRAGNTGDAISLVCIDEHKLLSDIEKLLGHKIEKITLAGYEPDPSIKSEPIFGRRNSSHQRGKPRGQEVRKPDGRHNMQGKKRGFRARQK